MDSPTRVLSEYIVKAKFEDIPETVIEKAKDLIMDSMGCAIGGGTVQPGKIIVDFFTHLGGYPEASILATGNKLPCIHAAYVNSHLANMLDFDDTSRVPVAHPGGTIIPPGLAVAEKIGANGKDLISAVVMAYEGWARIAQAINASVERRAKVWAFSTHQIFGAAIVSARLLKFDVEQTVNTMGYAGVYAPVPSSRKAGLELEDRPKTWVKTNSGWISLGGVMAAFLTEKGFVGSKSILDGEKGFWVMAGSDQCDFEKITLNLGKDYLISDISFKPYAACKYTHSSLDATAEIMVKYKIDVNRIKSIKVSTNRFVAERFGVSNPSDIIDAQYSLPHLIALELIGRSPRKGLADNNLTDPKVRSLAEKVSLEVSQELDEGYLQNRLFWAAIVSIELRDGSSFSERVDIPKWDPEKRPTREELRSKFTYLATPIVGFDTCEAILGDLEQLENLKDVSIMISRISQGVKWIKTKGGYSS